MSDNKNCQLLFITVFFYQQSKSTHFISGNLDYKSYLMALIEISNIEIPENDEPKVIGKVIIVYSQQLTSGGR